MNDLVIMKSQKALTTSLKVAEVFSKAHRTVLYKIRNLTAQNSAVKKMFAESTYVNRKGQEQPMFYMNRDGFSLLTMGFTGEAALQFKLEYIEAFNQMEQVVRANLPQTPEEKVDLMAQATSHINKRVTSLEQDVSFLKYNQEIDSGQRYELERVRKQKVMQVIGGAKSNFYQQKKSKKVFAKISKNFHDAFHVSRYEDIKKKDYDKAISYIKNWYPPYDLQNEIKEINAQTSLDI